MSIEDVEMLESSIDEAYDNLCRDYRTLDNLKRKNKELARDLFQLDQSGLEKVFDDIDSLLYYVCLSMEDSINVLGYQEATLQEIRDQYISS